MSDAMATVLHSQAVTVLYGVRALRSQPAAERETPRGLALAELVDRNAELLAVLLDPNQDAAGDAEPERCAEHGCEHPEDSRKEIRGMGGAPSQVLCVKCNCSLPVAAKEA